MARHKDQYIEYVAHDNEQQMYGCTNKTRNIRCYNSCNFFGGISGGCEAAIGEENNMISGMLIKKREIWTFVSPSIPFY